MVTIKQIAERAGVSTTTVSNVIHGKTKKVSPKKIEEIQRLIDEMGYVTPLGLSILHKKQSRMVAVIINRHQIYEQSILNDPFYGTIIGYIEEELNKNNYYMLFYSASNIEDIFNMVMTWNVDGAILISMPKRSSEKINYMIKKPVVCIDPVEDVSEKTEVAYISLDDQKGGWLMTKHLIELGYEAIHICGGTLQFGVDLQRVRGAQRALRESGKEKTVQVIPHSAGISYPERQKFYEYMYKHYPYNKKTALFCLADRYAVEASTYLQERGVVIPDEIGLAGFDGISYIAKNSFPRLTTIRQNVYQKASVAVREIIKAVEEPEYKMKDHLIDVSLVVRQLAI